MYLSSYGNYQTLFAELERELRNNITGYVEGATEPGLSKYSDLIVNNFDQSKLSKLEKYLQIKCTKKLRESLKTKFHLSYSGSSSYDSYGTSSYSHGYGGYHSSHNYGINYGQSHDSDLDSYSDSEEVSEIKPLEYQHANPVIAPRPAYTGGVKGGRRPPSETPVVPSSYGNLNSQPDAPNVPDQQLPGPSEVEIVPDETVTQKPGWWQRVKQGASKLKNKIVGET